MPVKITSSDYDKPSNVGAASWIGPTLPTPAIAASDHLMELHYSSGWVLRFNPKEIEALKAIPEEALALAYVTPGGDGLIFDNAKRRSASLASLPN